MHKKLKKYINCSYKKLNLLDEAWEKRLDPENSLLSPGLGGNITGYLDAFPIYIRRPSKNQNLFYNGKYGKHVIKVQVISDNKGYLTVFKPRHRS